MITREEYCNRARAWLQVFSRRPAWLRLDKDDVAQLTSLCERVLELDGEPVNLRDALEQQATTTTRKERE